MDARSEELQALVDADDLDGVLARVSVDEIAAAWCRATAIPPDERPDDHPDEWAIDLLYVTEVHRRTDFVRALLLALVAPADDDVLCVVGAGPLENFVSDDEQDLQWLEHECAANPKPRAALSIAWSASYVSEATLLRLDAAAGTPLPRPMPRDQMDPRRRDFVDRFDALRATMPDFERIPEMDAAGQQAVLDWLQASRELLEEHTREDEP